MSEEMESNNLNKAEKFLIIRMGERHPEISRSTRFMWAANYNLEKEVKGAFNSDDYANEEERACDMFPGMPVEELKTISLGMYKHRSTDHGGDHEKRIKELEEEVTDPELVELSVRKWWN